MFVFFVGSTTLGFGTTLGVVLHQKCHTKSHFLEVPPCGTPPLLSFSNTTNGIFQRDEKGDEIWLHLLEGRGDNLQEALSYYEWNCKKHTKIGDWIMCVYKKIKTFYYNKDNIETSTSRSLRIKTYVMKNRVIA